MSKDYYKILGVDKNASVDDIKKAYKKLAKQYHPDVNKESGSAEKFKEISEAAAVLGDPQKRQQYDQFGTAESPFAGANYQDFANFNFEDVFDSIFSGFGFGGFKRQRGHPGRDLGVEVSISLNDVAKGVSRDIRLQRAVECEACSGKGGTNPKTCSACNGQGMVRQTRRTAFGMFSTSGPCQTCRGTGEQYEHVCKQCDGEGRVISAEPITVKIPAGVHDENRVRVPGAGEAGSQGGPPGDLYVIVHVEEDDRFVRDGSDLLVEKEISFATACIGGTVSVPTLDGETDLDIKAGTQDKSELRIKGEGLPELRSRHRGDIIVRVSIAVPKKISKKQAELLKQFEKEGDKKILGLF